MTPSAGPDQNEFDDAGGTLLAVVGHMIPASAEFGLPGADDPAIFREILRSTGRDRAFLEEALGMIDAMAGGSLGSLPRDRQVTLLADFRAAEPERAAILEAVATRCYYRDDRVMTAIGIEVRAPFPIGYEVEEGDWSLLEPVRSRGRIWR
ncbi:MAG TPA: hypothetical protein VL202_24695 [Pararhizobium sp.]|uniref:hypothetical protein n=1 Tax=Pararhizobium sp. TaxID=1977563 RepID=UPI002CC59E9E|nr:hypothetical protein [Pararhizobium sp.]HTO34341.1 hypothetical protein [Pararhizobium sp.]